MDFTFMIHNNIASQARQNGAFEGIDLKKWFCKTIFSNQCLQKNQMRSDEVAEQVMQLKAGLNNRLFKFSQKKQKEFGAV